jgi:hypothetical protein
VPVVAERELALGGVREARRNGPVEEREVPFEAWAATHRRGGGEVVQHGSEAANDLRRLPAVLADLGQRDREEVVPPRQRHDEPGVASLVADAAPCSSWRVASRRRSDSSRSSTCTAVVGSLTGPRPNPSSTAVPRSAPSSRPIAAPRFSEPHRNLAARAPSVARQREERARLAPRVPATDVR